MDETDAVRPVGRGREDRSVEVEQLDRAPVRDGRHGQIGDLVEPGLHVEAEPEAVAREGEEAQPLLAPLEGLASVRSRS